jgi:hypothetical protein
MPRVNGFHIGKNKNYLVYKFLKCRESNTYAKHIDFVFDFRTGNIFCPFTKRHIIGDFDNFYDIRVWYVRNGWYPVFRNDTGEYLGFYEGYHWYSVEDALKMDRSHGIQYEDDL